jgi:hypothetical protein
MLLDEGYREDETEKVRGKTEVRQGGSAPVDYLAAGWDSQT